MNPIVKSHELAQMLLRLPDKPVEFVKGEGQYTSEWEMVGVPWDFWGGTVRLQIQPRVYAAEATSTAGGVNAE